MKSLLGSNKLEIVFTGDWMKWLVTSRIMRGLPMEQQSSRHATGE